MSCCQCRAQAPPTSLFSNQKRFLIKPSGKETPPRAAEERVVVTFPAPNPELSNFLDRDPLCGFTYPETQLSGSYTHLCFCQLGTLMQSLSFCSLPVCSLLFSVL